MCSRLFPTWHGASHKGATSTVDPTLDRAPGTYHCWVDGPSVNSKFAQGFAHMTNAAEIEPKTLGYLVQRLKRSATRSTMTVHKYNHNTSSYHVYKALGKHGIHATSGFTPVMGAWLLAAHAQTICMLKRR